MLKIVRSTQFKRDLKTVIRRGVDISRLGQVVDKLAKGEKLAEIYKDHKLKGKLQGFRELHIEPDWLLIYRIEKEELELFLFRTGTHSDLLD